MHKKRFHKKIPRGFLSQAAKDEIFETRIIDSSDDHFHEDLCKEYGKDGFVFDEEIEVRIVLGGTATRTTFEY